MGGLSLAAAASQENLCLPDPDLARSRHGRIACATWTLIQLVSISVTDCVLHVSCSAWGAREGGTRGDSGGKNSNTQEKLAHKQPDNPRLALELHCMFESGTLIV